MVRAVSILATLALLALAGCGASGTDAGSRLTGSSASPSPSPPSHAPSQADVVRATCPAGAANCRSASGRIIYVEAVDPDGDGDAHFVLLSSESVTGPGISVIDVERGLRPDPLPGIGDEVSAAGPVYTGSYGQRQIQAEELHVARR